MTSYTAAGPCKHATLAANTVDIVTLNTDYPFVEVVNRDATTDLYFTVDTVTGASVTPTVGGDGCFYVGPGASRIVNAGRDDAAHTPATVTRLISTGAVAYTVTGIVG